ncbi:MAG TPA: hypothetical protein VKX17_00065 [Planctomycetota bacterium]|nr:hypothetical protein [Planctomycetota bacterium]
MPEPPRRWRFQIHLSTAIVLMFVAGGLIWANVTVTESNYTSEGFKEGRWNKAEVYDRMYGWPDQFWQETLERGANGEYVPVVPVRYRRRIIVRNALVALAILFVVWFLCEWLIRRRAARKGA